MMLDELIFQMISLGRRGSMSFGASVEELASGRLTYGDGREGGERGRIQENVHQDLTCAVKGVPGTQHLSPHCGCASVSSWEGRESSITNLWGLLGARSEMSIIMDIICSLQGAVELLHWGCRFYWDFYYAHLEEWLCRRLQLCLLLCIIPSPWRFSDTDEQPRTSQTSTVPIKGP